MGEKLRSLSNPESNKTISKDEVQAFLMRGVIDQNHAFLLYNLFH